MLQPQRDTAEHLYLYKHSTTTPAAYRSVVSMLLYSCTVSVLLLAAVSAVSAGERDWGYYGYEEHALREGTHVSTAVHNPFLGDRVVREIPERYSGHHVEIREIFGEDNRGEVDRESIPEENRIPELATVLISVGCTGMLVTPEHVLTAAHCVHTEGHFKEGYSSLEVAVEMQYGLEWRRVNTIFLPSNWTNPDRDINPDYYDYAVLAIEPLTTAHLPVALSSDRQHGVNSRLSIVAYFDDKPLKTKWMTSCNIVDEDEGILWHECDVTYGGSGAGMYGPHRNPATNENELRTIGILSGYDYDANKEQELNYAVRINPVNYYYVCSWTCQMEWCLQQLGGQEEREIREKGQGWVLDKLKDRVPPYCG